jgi:tetratricopeptide (TPR) repeat protein
MDSKELKKILSEARKKREYGQFPEALAALHQVNNEFPDNAQYRYLLAATYYESGNTDAALKYAEEALSIDPEHKETYELLGDIYAKQDDTEKAIANYEKAYQLDSQYLFVEEKLIKIYFKVQNYEGVIHVCDNLMSHVPVDKSTAKSRALTSVYLGTLLHKSYGFIYLKRYEEAIAGLLNRRKMNIELGLPVYAGQYKNDDESIFKMYFKLGNTEETDKYRELLKREYKISDEELKILEEDAKGDIIINRQKHNIPW